MLSAMVSIEVYLTLGYSLTTAAALPLFISSQICCQCIRTTLIGPNILPKEDLIRTQT